ncbi:MAG: hypothetical protein EP338_12300 [Bacteroidetes bacterium]|nr:MAG: hypothetical protein EP338_12300 [Bacteroidota bacterium]
MGFIQKDALRTMILNYLGMALGYLNKGVLFLIIFEPEQYGLINLLLGVGLLFAHLSNLGAMNAILRFLPFFKDQEDRRQGFLLLNVLFVFGGILLFSTLAIVLQSTVVNFYSRNSELFVDYYFWIIPIGIANVLFLVFSSYLRALFKNVLAVFVYEFGLRLLTTILLFMALWEWIDFNDFLISYTLIYFIPAFVLLIYLFTSNEIRFRKSTFRISRKFKKIIFSYSLFAYTNSIGMKVVITLDSLMIAYYEGLSETGVYTTLLYFLSAMFIPYQALYRISAPLVPQYWKEKNMVELKDLYQKFSSISLILALFVGMLVWCNKDALFAFLPAEFQGGVWAFLFLLLGRAIDTYAGLNGYILITSKKYRLDLIFTGGLILLVFFLNYLLIPIYGISGAAIATGIGYLLYNLGRLIFVYLFYKLHPFESGQLKVFLLATAVITIFEISPDFIDNPFLSISFKSLIISLLFALPVYAFRWNPDLNDYIQNALSFLNQKLNKKRLKNEEDS